MYYNLCLDSEVMDSSEEEQLIKSPMLSDKGKWSQGVILVNKRFRQMVYRYWRIMSEVKSLSVKNKQLAEK